MADELFTTTMRRATRKAHAVSDALVNAKLLFALNNNKVWAEGLLIFYEIFKFLEYAMLEKKDENLGKLYIEEMARTEAFEKDLGNYLGQDWKKTYTIRDSVQNYLNHLQSLLQTDSDLLMAYVYHLYMGLLSGGQILRKKREMQNAVLRTDSNTEEAVTDFSDSSISELKTLLKDRMNEIATTLDDTKKELLVKESIKVFELNNSIIKTVQGAERVATKNLIIFFSCAVLVISLIYYYGSVFLKKIVKI